MYQDLKLEKGMYHITGKSFSEVLEAWTRLVRMPKHPLPDWTRMSVS